MVGDQIVFDSDILWHFKEKIEDQMALNSRIHIQQTEFDNHLRGIMLNVKWFSYVSVFDERRSFDSSPLILDE